MNHDDLCRWSKLAADWAHDYHAGLRDRPVRARTQPGEIAAQLPRAAPEQPEAMETIFEDFARIVPDGMTHWQHPRFFAYFPSNAAPASMLAEQLTNAMAAQAMLWQTSPAATEMETVMVGWLRDALGLPPHFTGVIHDTATTATLSAVLTMRERALSWAGNTKGLSGGPRLRFYSSTQVHSSVDKAVRVAGIGQDNLVKVRTDESHAMDTRALDAAIRADLAAGHRPAGVILCVGATGIGASDRLREAIEVARDHDLPTHVDAAWAGSAMICPEYRHLWEGADEADSVVFNPHKWLGVQMDCSIQFLADPSAQVRTLGLRPDYLQTPRQSEITNYNEWTIPLGRRFRALKIWFTLRAYGLEGLRRRIRNHIAWSEELAEAMARLPGVEIVTPPALSLFSFALKEGDAATEALLTRINDDGRVYLTQTRHEGRFVIRVQVGQFDCTRGDVLMVHRVVEEFT